MGIRIHKAVGWGLNNLQTKQTGGKHPLTVTADPRFDAEAFRKVYVHVRGFAQFAAWTQEPSVKARIYELLRRETPWADAKGDPPGGYAFKQYTRNAGRPQYKRWDVGSCFIHGDEYHSAEALLVIPPEMLSTWFRHDNTIDWIEESEAAGLQGPSNRTQMLTGCGIYPYSAGWIRHRDPAPGLWSDSTRHVQHRDELGPLALDPASYSMLTGRWSPDQLASAQGDLLKHLREDWRPLVPGGVIAILVYYETHGCFPQGTEALIDDLRPMLYAWWS